MAVQYVNAPESVVWDTILNYPMYTEWVDNVVQSSVYKTAHKMWRSKILYVELISSVMFVKFGVYTINYLCKEQHYMHWTLDYDRQSDTKDMVGYWRVEQISTNPPVTRVDYATEMLVVGVPDFLASYLTKDALINGTKWVKRSGEGCELMRCTQIFDPKVYDISFAQRFDCDHLGFFQALLWGRAHFFNVCHCLCKASKRHD